MKSSKAARGRLSREEKRFSLKTNLVEQSASVPSLTKGSKTAPKRDKNPLPTSPREGISTSESNLSAHHHGNQDHVIQQPAAKGDEVRTPEDMEYHGKGRAKMARLHDDHSHACKPDRKCPHGMPVKKTRSCSPCGMSVEAEDPMVRQIRDIHTESRKSARIIRDSRARLLEIQKKQTLTEADVRELGERNELLLREMDRFDRLTRMVQKLVGAEAAQVRRRSPRAPVELPGKAYEPPVYHESKASHPTILLAGGRTHGPPGLIIAEPNRSKSEIDLTRKLSESYDMQEKLVADNADLEVKRYILYKELMTKDQNLETCRGQMRRLQGELKMMSKENALLHEKLDKNNPEGDATAMNPDDTCHPELIDIPKKPNDFDLKAAEELVAKLEDYKTSTLELEKQLGALEFEVRNIRVEMSNVKGGGQGGQAGQPGKNGKEGSACRDAQGNNTCYKQEPGQPPEPPMNRACGVCPPCPAPCNPNAPPTPAEREVQRLTLVLKQTEESFKTKVTECAMLRTELLKKKEELEKERCQHREVQNKLRELEMKFEGLATHTKMMLGNKEQAFEQEVNVRALKQCYREAREEIDELRLLMKEQNDQLQDYRVKYLAAQQLVEEQRRQMDMMDMDNTRISEQINLEIQRVKIKFQEKLQELAPIPDLLKATQMRLKDAQQSQAIAEHNAEQLARELNCAREKVHILLHNSLKAAEKPVETKADEKQIALLQQRIAQLTETNQSLKSEIERLKANVIRMEESVLANERRLQEKMHECAQLGGELDRTRDEAARALQRANDRTETIRKCMQTTVAELERQLAASRAQVKTAEKDRTEVQNRMNCQIKRLNENFEQAQYRIIGLQTQVQALRKTTSSTDQGEGEGDGDNEDQDECQCKAYFDE